MEEMIKDNWLKEEKAREAKISIWEMYDNRKVVYDEHRENCEREEVAESHSNAHNYQNTVLRSANANPDKAAEVIISTVASIIVFVVLFIIFLFV